MKLKGIKLEVINIYRKGIFEADFVFCCDNCGRAIVNSATVKDDSGKEYVIGLDCKKTLIDKPIIDKILSENPDYIGKYKAKEFKREQTDIQKVAMFLDNPDKYECKLDTVGGQYLTVYDNTKKDPFGNYGVTVFSESIPYLFKIGLKDLLQSAINKNIITKY